MSAPAGKEFTLSLFLVSAVAVQGEAMPRVCCGTGQGPEEEEQGPCGPARDLGLHHHGELIIIGVFSLDFPFPYCVKSM